MRILPVHFLSALFLAPTLAAAAALPAQRTGPAGQDPVRAHWDEVARALGERHTVRSVYPPDPKVEELRRALATTIVPQLVVQDEEHLSAVLDAVRAVTGLPIVADPRAQEAVYDEGVVFQLDLAQPLSAEQVLNLVAEAGGEELAWTIVGDTVFFTTEERAREEPVIFLHMIADLFPTFEADDLATLVQENVRPGSWEEEGVSIEADGAFLVVVNTVPAQIECERLLADLRTFQAGMAAGRTTLETRSSPVDARDLAVLERLATVRFSPRFGNEGEGVHLTKIAAFLQQLTEVNFVVAPSVLDEVDSEELSFVLDLPERSVRDVLDVLVRLQDSVAWRVTNGVVEFALRDRISGGQTLVLHDIRELVFPGDPAFALDEGEPGPQVIDPNMLEDLIRNQIGRDSWDEDPANTLRISEEGVMIVNQRPEVQARIRALLDDLRKVARVMRGD